ncbi:MAG: P-loop NTPase fold protein [Acidimicrobiia bacterium]
MCALFPWTRRKRVAARLALVDRPYRLASDAYAAEPEFGFRLLAESIARVIQDSDPQLTLAVYGEWGVGKTTLFACHTGARAHRGLCRRVVRHVGVPEPGERRRATA